MAKGKGGRPSKFSPEVQEKIVSALTRGAYIETACTLAGVDKKTFYNWIRRGDEAGSGEYFECFHS